MQNADEDDDDDEDDDAFDDGNARVSGERVADWRTRRSPLFLPFILRGPHFSSQSRNPLVSV